MEVELRCNNIQCRKGLGLGKACVTTCSHIFCVDCANEAFGRALVCPACDTSLTENDDVVYTELNPSEDYKSSVLAGLRPEIIVDIAGRALSFWVYQATQESNFQEMLYKSLEEKYSNLERHTANVVREANQEIQALQNKVTALQKEHEMEKRRSHETSEQLQEKGRQFQKLQLMYDKLKRKTLIGQPGHQNQPPPQQQAAPPSNFNAVPQLPSSRSSMRQAVQGLSINKPLINIDSPGSSSGRNQSSGFNEPTGFQNQFQNANRQNSNNQFTDFSSSSANRRPFSRSFSGVHSGSGSFGAFQQTTGTTNNSVASGRNQQIQEIGRPRLASFQPSQTPRSRSSSNLRGFPF